MTIDDDNIPTYDEEEVLPQVASAIEDGADEGEAWLMSYADMMTLIACFFILMTAFASYEKGTFARAAKEVKKHFRGANVQTKQDHMTELISKLEAVTQNREVLKIKSMDNGIEIRFNSVYLFETASANLKPQMDELLSVMAQVIMGYGKDFIIEAHGHTDSRPLSRNSKYRDNWELSSARAISVIRKFEQLDYDSKLLMATGHGKSRPEVLDIDKSGNYIESNLVRNRRVILLVKKAHQSFSLGLGEIYKKNSNK